MLLALQCLLLIVIGSSIVFYLSGTLCTWQFFRQVPSPTTNGIAQVPAGEPRPTASILVPVCGLEDEAAQTWEQLCCQDYGPYEVLFGVKDADDPAVPVLKELVTRFPERARLIPCPEVRGINYKISTLLQLLEIAQNEVILFADSDIRVGPDYLQTVTAPLERPEVGLVTCAYVSRHPQTLGAALGSLGRCVDFIPSVLVARQLDGGLRFALGATVATRRCLLKSLPELPTLANRIGDDYHIGRLVAAAGYNVELSTYVVEISLGQETIRQVFARELRWSRTIRCNRGRQYYGLGLVYGTVYCLPLLLLSGCQSWAVGVTLVTWLCRGVQVLVALRQLSCPGLWPWLWALPLRDGMNLLLWLLGILGNQVTWRGRQLRVAPGGFIQESIPEQARVS